MVAQVHPSAASPAQTAGQHVVHFHAGRAQPVGIGAQALLGTDGIQQQTALHSAGGGADQGLGNGLAHGVFVHEVIQKVCTCAGPVDGFNQRPERAVVVIKQLHRVAAHRHESPQPFNQGRDLAVGGGAGWGPAQGGLRRLTFTDGLGCFGLATDPFVREPGMAEQ